jgi:hypothetical protein
MQKARALSKLGARERKERERKVEKRERGKRERERKVERRERGKRD